MSTPLPDHVRKTEILTAAIKLAETEGLSETTRDQIAALAGCSTGLVNLHFGTMLNLRRAIVGEAVRTKNLNVIAQALVAPDKKTRGLAQRAPEALRREALETLMG